ncbi:hypothetical protein [Candidatus Synechococcus spongiarum]|uniref:Uncharacterized protein n=1 Tax=Candidatus Synechococcus spongiarum TaxID=431041 RepID=A0A170T898_9SYNE|nr:hypothetical protein [Candidatus Synechococcus spongiarum]CZB17033.1 hypothetical protein FLM9_782 [Candidatus Synechococcus spongiarum]
MTSGTPTTKSQVLPPPTAGAPAGERWRQWREPAVASPIITALVISLVSVGVVGFQSLKGDIRDVEARLTAEIRSSEDRQREDLKLVREDVRALSDKLDRVLESLLAAQ